MKTLRFVPLLAVVTGLLSVGAQAKDHGDHGHHGGHGDHGYYNNHHYSSGGYHSGSGIHIGVGVVPRPYYGPSVVYVDRSSHSGSSLEVDVQRRLARAGYYHGPIDGDIGPGSRAAIRNFQADHGLEPTGRISRTLLAELR